MRACLMRIDAPHYVAGIVWQVDIEHYETFRTVGQVLKAVQAAPIVYWIIKKNYAFEWAKSYFERKGFKVEIIEFQHPNEYPDDWETDYG